MFSEKQQFRQVWLWSLLALTVLAVAASAVIATGAAVGGDTSVLVLYLVWSAVVLMSALVGFFAMGALVTEAREEGLWVRFVPFRGRLIRYDEIESATAREYSPIREYGGWGYRIGAAGKAFSVSGNRGVQLVLTNETRVLIGSQKADELATAINRHVG